MYYTVKLDKKVYASKEIVKHLYKIGDAGLVRETSNGNLKAVQIMSVTLYELPSDKLNELDAVAMGIQEQDLNAQLKTFRSVKEDDKLLTNAKGCTSFTLKDITFIELRTLLFCKKYQMQDQLPCLDVCGTRYVAVNAVRKDSDIYISY